METVINERIGPFQVRFLLGQSGDKKEGLIDLRKRSEKTFLRLWPQGFETSTGVKRDEVIQRTTPENIMFKGAVAREEHI